MKGHSFYYKPINSDNLAALPTKAISVKLKQKAHPTANFKKIKRIKAGVVQKIINIYSRIYSLPLRYQIVKGDQIQQNLDLPSPLHIYLLFYGIISTLSAPNSLIILNLNRSIAVATLSPSTDTSSVAS